MKRFYLSLMMILVLSIGNAFAADTVIVKSDYKTQLSADKVIMLDKAVAAQAVKSKDINIKIKSLRKDLRILLAADSFNKEEYLKKSAELSKFESEKFMSKADAIAEIAPKFTPAERKIVAKAFNRAAGSKKHTIYKNPKIN